MADSFLYRNACELVSSVETGRTSLIRKLTAKSCPAIAVYNDFKYSTRSFFSCSVKFSFLKLL